MPMMSFLDGMKYKIACQLIQLMLRTSGGVLHRLPRFACSPNVALSPISLAKYAQVFHARNMSSALSDAIKEDHQEMYQYYDRYRDCGRATDRDGQARWSRQLIWEVARHAVAEEIVVYPLMEKHLGQKGKELADGDRSDHQYVKEKLSMIESLTPGSAEYDSVLADVMSHLHEHNDSEEKNDLPQLERMLADEGSTHAAKQFSRTKMFVPTRAHPSAPNKPPYETLVGFFAMPMDKLKDMFAKFP